MKYLPTFFLLAFAIFFSNGCTPAHESNTTLEPQQARIPTGTPRTERAFIALGEFTNRSTYMNGVFSDGLDRLGKQSNQILTTHLSTLPDYTVVDRRSMERLGQESRYLGAKQKIQGATVVINGAVTEFGRRETGTRGLAGILSKSKTQTLYAKVSISPVESSSSRVLGSYQGAGEYALSNSEILGFGSTAGYDSTLADKVLNLAIMEAVTRMTEARRAGTW